MDHINYVFTVDLSKINLNHHYLTMNSYNDSVSKFDNSVLLKNNCRKISMINIHLLNVFLFTYQCILIEENDIKLSLCFV